MSRGALPPPEIEGLAYKRLIGSGGFADVFLYEDTQLKRDVVIKVLRNTLDDAETREAFEAESQLMARVSGHPYIADIYSVGVASDGRPYLLTKFYPRPTYSQRIKVAPLTVAEGLKRGIEVCSAVETLHAANIMHRDIKPANLLTDEYGKPQLTDFGISGTHADDSMGYSPPYAAPEVVEDTSPGDQRSDVYSLGATIYALLVGRSPFEIDSADNTRSAVTERVLNGAPQRMGRRDAPEMLERLIAQCLSRDPDKRPQSAQALARSLQQIQRHLQYEVTEFVTVAPPAGDSSVDKPGIDDDEERTRFGGVRVVDPEQASGPRGRTSPPVLIAEIPTGTSFEAPHPVPFQVEQIPTPPEEATVHDQLLRKQEEPEAPPAPEIRTTPRWQLVAGGAVVAVVMTIVAVVLATGGGEPENATTSTLASSALVIVEVPDTPTDVAITIDGSAADVTWKAPGATEGDSYQVSYMFGLDADPIRADTPDLSLRITDVPAGSDVCVEVLAIRNGRFSESTSIKCEGR